MIHTMPDLYEVCLQVQPNILYSVTVEHTCALRVARTPYSVGGRVSSPILLLRHPVISVERVVDSLTRLGTRCNRGPAKLGPLGFQGFQGELRWNMEVSDLGTS